MGYFADPRSVEDKVEHAQRFMACRERAKVLLFAARATPYAAGLLQEGGTAAGCGLKILEALSIVVTCHALLRPHLAAMVAATDDATTSTTLRVLLNMSRTDDIAAWRFVQDVVRWLADFRSTDAVLAFEYLDEVATRVRLPTCQVGAALSVGVQRVEDLGFEDPAPDLAAVVLMFGGNCFRRMAEPAARHLQAEHVPWCSKCLERGVKPSLVLWFLHRPRPVRSAFGAFLWGLPLSEYVQAWPPMTRQK